MIRSFLKAFGMEPVSTPSDAARTLAKAGADKRRAHVIATMNTLRAQMGMEPFKGSEGA